MVREQQVVATQVNRVKGVANWGGGDFKIKKSVHNCKLLNQAKGNSKNNWSFLSL
jgi:hypothetical protein